MDEKIQDGLSRELQKQLQKLAITKQLNFLIGSGASMPTIPPMSSFSDNDNQSANDQLTEKVREVSKQILAQDKTVKDTQEDYNRFIQTVVNLLNLSNSRQTPKNANIFTTNYDLFIEQAADNILKNNRMIFNDGSGGYFNRVLNSGNYNRVTAYKGVNDNYISEIPSISLIKPHGSMNWEKVGVDIKITNSVVEYPVIVPPTGYESADTYLSNHFYEMLRIFETELDKPQSVLFVIGFSFQDKHIGKMIKRALQNTELMIYAIAHKSNASNAEEDDGKIFLKNLELGSEPNNFKIISPEQGINYTLADFTTWLANSSESEITIDTK